MNTKTILFVLPLALSTISTPFSSARAQGALTPPGAPAPTMKSLAQIEPRTPISSLPYVINSPGSYYVTTNLTSTGGGLNGINISASDVTLDLSGFTLQGVSGSGKGIYVTSSYFNIVVHNGTVTGWTSYGVDAFSGGFPRNLVFENLTVSANGDWGLYTEAGSVVRDCLFFNNYGGGINSAGGEITRCICRGSTGGDGIDIALGTINQCVLEGNSGYGVQLNTSRALDCDIQNNTSAGVNCLGTADEIRGCRITSNQNVGIFNGSPNGENTIADCLIANNTSYGIYTAGSGRSSITGNHLVLNGNGGIVINDSNNHIENNRVATSSGVVGIEVNSVTNNVVIKNDVEGDGGGNYSGSFGNDFGPIGTAATATSPWANLSH